MNRSQISFLVAILLISSCKEDQLKRNFPVVSTDEVTALSAAGVTFQGGFSNPSSETILDRGFVWGSSAELSLQSSFSASLGPSAAGKFKYELKSALNTGQDYYVRAFVKGASHTVYGPIRKFTSLGSLAQSITDFTPKIGKIGDTLTIIGTGFTSTTSNESVLFQFDATVISAKPISTSPTKIKLLIPSGINKRRVTLAVKIGDVISNANSEFELMIPGILSVDPSMKMCDTLLIQWQSYGQSLRSLSLNGTVQLNFKATATQIRVPVTDLSPSLTVRIEAGNYYDEKTFAVAPENPFASTVFPVLLSSQDILRLKTDRMISCGRFFARIKGTEVKAVQIGTTASEIQMGIQNYDDLPATFQLEFYTNERSPIPFFTSSTITKGPPSPWLKKKPFFSGAPAPVIGSATFVINGAGYVVAGSTSPTLPATHNQDISRYDPGTDTWTSNGNIYLGIFGTRCSGFSIGGKGYVCTPPGLMWEFNGGMRQLAGSPSATDTRYFNVAFDLGGEIYLGGAASSGSSSNALLKYNIATDSWSLKAPIPTSTPPANTPQTLSFSFNGLGYYFMREGNNQLRRMIYNPTTDSWTSDISDFISPFKFGLCATFILSSSVLVIDESGYISQVDPVANTWTYKGFAPTVGGVSFSRGFSFKIGSKGYMGLAFIGDHLNDVWEVDLTKF